MSLSHLRPLTAGEILDGAFTLYRRHFSTLFATALLPLLPVILGWAAAAVLLRGASPDAVTGLVLLGTLYTGIATLFLRGALIYQLWQGITGGEVSRATGFARARVCFWSLVGAAFLYNFATGVGTLLCLVPGIVFYFLLFLSPQAVVVEGATPGVALERSWKLVRSDWLRVVGVLLVAGIIYLVPFAVPVAADALSTEVGWLAFVSQSAQVLVTALAYPLVVAVSTLLYADLRVRTEALDLEIAAHRLVAAG